MIDDNDMLSLGRRGQLTANVTYLMLKGAGYAALAVLVVWLGIALLSWFANTFLPEDRLFTPDPINRSDVVIELPEVRAV